MARRRPSCLFSWRVRPRAVELQREEALRLSVLRRRASAVFLIGRQRQPLVVAAVLPGPALVRSCRWATQYLLLTWLQQRTRHAQPQARAGAGGKVLACLPAFPEPSETLPSPYLSGTSS